jgi:hypothetical protein
MANFTFDGKVLLSTDDSEPALGKPRQFVNAEGSSGDLAISEYTFVPSETGHIIDPSGCAANFRLEAAHRLGHPVLGDAQSYADTAPKCAGCFQPLAYCTCYDDSGGI